MKFEEFLQISVACNPSLESYKRTAADMTSICEWTLDFIDTAQIEKTPCCLTTLPLQMVNPTTIVAWKQQPYLTHDVTTIIYNHIRCLQLFYVRVIIYCKNMWSASYWLRRLGCHHDDSRFYLFFCISLSCYAYCENLIWRTEKKQHYIASTVVC